MAGSYLDGKTVLVTGGTGSFGQQFVSTALKTTQLEKIIVFSRDEWKQSEMQKRIQDERVRFFLGDIRDVQRLQRAFRGVDVVIHAAALKQVPTLEYNPFEAVQTNIIGSQNVINAAIDQKVGKVVALSTDKAVNPVNLYGATKLCAEKLFVDGNSYAGDQKIRFSLVRYGNVMGSRGSVIPLFLQQRRTRSLFVTDNRMTRFWLTLAQSVQLVMSAVEDMQGGEIFIPRIPSMKIRDLALSIGPDCTIKEIGIRPGEKIHETLISEDESSRTYQTDRYFVIQPVHTAWSQGQKPKGKKVPVGFRYASDNNTEWLTHKDLRHLVELDSRAAA